MKSKTEAQRRSPMVKFTSSNKRTRASVLTGSRNGCIGCTIKCRMDFLQPYLIITCKMHMTHDSFPRLPQFPLTRWNTKISMEIRDNSATRSCPFMLRVISLRGNIEWFWVEVQGAGYPWVSVLLSLRRRNNRPILTREDRKSNT
jgi:hypothetical protein